MTVKLTAAALLGSDIPEGILDAPFVRVPLQMLLMLASVLLAAFAVIACIATVLWLVRVLRPSAIRTWWKRPLPKLMEFTAGAFGASFGFKLAEEKIANIEAADDARDVMIDALRAEVAALRELAEPRARSRRRVTPQDIARWRVIEKRTRAATEQFDGAKQVRDRVKLHRPGRAFAPAKSRP